MRALASSFSAWRLLEQQEGTKVPHGLVYSLAVVESIGRPHGLELVAEEYGLARGAPRPTPPRCATCTSERAA